MLKGLYIKIIARLTPSCQELARLSSEALERKLSLREKLLIRLHNTVCSWCQCYEKQLQSIHQAVEGKGDVLGEEVDCCMSQDKKERLKSLLKDE